MMALLATVVALARPWSRVYNDSDAAQSGILFLHFGALLLAGGYALAADRWVLRAGRLPQEARGTILHELRSLHRPVLIGLFLLIVTGSAMALADAETLLVMPVFWVKMGCFALLLINGVTLLRAEKRLRDQPADETLFPRQWRRLQWAARRSFSLWMLTLLVGTLLGTSA